MPQTFTLKELSRFDGKDGRAAYIAVDGTCMTCRPAPRGPRESTPPAM